MSDPRSELLQLTEQLLAAIVGRDWSRYEQLCDPQLTAFEPEAVGHRVRGLPFHQFYFQRAASSGVPPQITLVDPEVLMLGDDVAVVTYVRLVQRFDAAGAMHTTAHEETRIWHRRNGAWRHVHFHRSVAGPQS